MSALDRRGRWCAFGTFESDAHAVTYFADDLKLDCFALHLHRWLRGLFVDKGLVKGLRGAAA
jgi:hypothetical protein